MGAHHARDPQKPHNELTEASHNAHGGLAKTLQKPRRMLTETSRKPTKLQIVNIIVILKKIIIWYYVSFT